MMGLLHWLIGGLRHARSVLLSSHPRPSPPPGSAFAGFRFPAEVIVLAVRWYLRYGLNQDDRNAAAAAVVARYASRVLAASGAAQPWRDESGATGSAS
jgi:hypothetical protein